MQEHLYISLISESLLLRQVLSSFDIGHWQPHRDGFERHRSPGLAGFHRAFHDLRGDFGVVVPPLSLRGFTPEFRYDDLAAPFGIQDRNQRPDLVRPKQSTRSSLPRC